MNSKLCYNKDAANEFIMIVDIIEKFWNVAEKGNWSKDSHIEIGFYIPKYNKNKNIFFGIWYDAWAQFEIPLSFVITYKSHNKQSVMKYLSQYFFELKNVNLKINENYDGFFVVCINHDFFDFKNLNNSLTDLNTIAKKIESIINLPS